jgi:hypothetical protein
MSNYNFAFRTGHNGTKMRRNNDFPYYRQEDRAGWPYGQELPREEMFGESGGNNWGNGQSGEYDWEREHYRYADCFYNEFPREEMYYTDNVSYDGSHGGSCWGNAPSRNYDWEMDYYRDTERWNYSYGRREFDHMNREGEPVYNNNQASFFFLNLIKE